MQKILKSESELDAVLSECPSVFVLFYASWCGFSQEFLPIFKKYAKGNDQKFCMLVIDRAPSCEDKYSIDIVPTVIYFEKGRPVKRLDGVSGYGLDEEQLRGLISSCESAKG